MSMPFLCIAFVLIFSCREELQWSQNWTHYVRIAGHPLAQPVIDSIIRSAESSHVFGIEVDNDIPGRYDSFLNPDQKLEEIRLVSEKAHAIGNHTFVYIAGLECITDRALGKNYSFYKDHPDWLQRDIAGKPAIFGDKDAFWIKKGDEDVWISPYASEWRERYMRQVRQIAATGVDGVYVDIPYWMTHFEGWWDTWASFDCYTVDAFQKKSGLNARKDIRLGDITDPGFRKWIDFRINTITGFMAEIDKNVKSVNSNCKTIAEIYPGLGEDAVRVGADVYRLYTVVDAICHEYSEGAYMAASREPVDWFSYMAGMYSFRAFAEDKSSWMLSYSWDGEEHVRASDAMKLLFLSQIMAGTNVWDAQGHIMSRSNDIKTRTHVFRWIEEHEKCFYLPRKPITPIGVYFSPRTRDYFPEDFFPSYMGLLQMLLHAQLEFQIVTPRSLDAFTGQIMILPNVQCLSEKEVNTIKSKLNTGMRLVFSAATGSYDDAGNKRQKNILEQILQIELGPQSIQDLTFQYYPENFSRTYFAEVQENYNRSAWEGVIAETPFDNLREKYIQRIAKGLHYQPAVTIKSSPFLCTQIARVDNRVYIFLINFKGIKGGERLQPMCENDIKIHIKTSAQQEVYFLPYLGEKRKLSTKLVGNRLQVEIPEIEWGGVLWLE